MQFNGQEIHHIVFDFDGVIVDSEKQKFSNMQEVLKQRGVELSRDQYLDQIGKKRIVYMKELGIPDADVVMEELHRLDRENTELELLPGIIEFLEYGQSQGVGMHIATGAQERFVNVILDRFDLRKYFTLMLTDTEVKVSKPDPAIYLKIKEMIDQEGILVIEDSPAGVTAAKRAGLPVVSVLPNDEADVSVGSYEELKKCLI